MKVPWYPTIIWWKNNQKQEGYGGGRSKDSIVKWVKSTVDELKRIREQKARDKAEKEYLKKELEEKEKREKEQQEQIEKDLKKLQERDQKDAENWIGKERLAQLQQK